MADLLLEPSFSLPSLPSTTLLGPDETGGLEDVDFTPMAKRRDSRRSENTKSCANKEDSNLYEEKDDEEDVFGDDPPSMTLREILLNADTSHFHLLGLFHFCLFLINNGWLFTFAL